MNLMSFCKRRCVPMTKSHLPSATSEERLFYLRRRPEAAEHLYVNRVTCEALHRRLIMLLGQDGGRHEYGRLLPVEDTLHHGAQGRPRFCRSPRRRKAGGPSARASPCRTLSPPRSGAGRRSPRRGSAPQTQSARENPAQRRDPGGGARSA